jgi:hypothetical protein
VPDGGQIPCGQGKFPVCATAIPANILESRDFLGISRIASREILHIGQGIFCAAQGIFYAEQGILLRHREFVRFIGNSNIA